MLPTFTAPTNTSANPLQGSTTNLLPGEAIEPVAAFATEMKVYRAIPVTPPDSGEWGATGVVGESGELLPDGVGITPQGGELSPLDGKELPVDLRVMLDELRGLGYREDSSLKPDGLPLASVDIDNGSGAGVSPIGSALDVEFPIYTTVDLELPPGLTLETRLTGEAANLSGLVSAGSGVVNSDNAGFLMASGADPEANLSQLPASRDALIERLSQLVNVSADKLEAIAEKRGASTADLQRITDFLMRKQAVAAQSLAVAARAESATATPAPGQSAAPMPAPLARIDGTVHDGKSQRFRPLGVGLPVAETRVTPTVVELDSAVPELNKASHTRADVLASDILRQEAMSTLKPGSGAPQPAVSLQGASNTAPGQAFQAVDTAAKPLPGSIDVPVRDASWGDRLNDRVVMMANNRLQNIDLRLSPAELGPLRVKVSVEDGTANVSFVTQHAVTRDAIEQALPRLKLLLEQNGIDLGNTSVDQHSAEQGAADANSEGAESTSQEDALDARRSGRGEDGGVDSDPSSGRAVRLSRGLLDTFA